MIARILATIKRIALIAGHIVAGAFGLQLDPDLQPVLNGLTAAVSLGLWVWGLALLIGAEGAMAVILWIFVGGLFTAIAAAILVRVAFFAATLVCGIFYAVWTYVFHRQEFFHDA